MEERRTAARLLTCIPAYVGSKEDSAHLALIHDLSETGALLFTRAKLDLDEELTMTLYLSPEQQPPRPATGKVVRVMQRAIERSDVWQWEVGVEFHSSISEFADEIEALCRRQREAGILKG